MSMENIAGARKPAKREDERTVAGEHRMMRRADREVTDPEQIAAIIAACDIVEVAYADAEGLAIVPLNFGFDYEYDEADGVAATVLVNGAETVGSTGVVAADEVGCPGKLTLWFHSAPHGRKLDAIRAAAGGRLPVAFTMQADCEVVAGRTTCNWGEAFKSIVGNGEASLVKDLGECRHGLQALMGAAGAHAARRIHRRAGAQRHSVEDRGRLLHHQGPCQARARAHASAPCRAARRCDRCPITSLQQGWDVGCGAAQRFLTYRVPRPAPSLVMVPLSSSVFSVRSTVLALISGNC